MPEGVVDRLAPRLDRVDRARQPPRFDPAPGDVGAQEQQQGPEQESTNTRENRPHRASVYAQRHADSEVTRRLWPDVFRLRRAEPIQDPAVVAPIQVEAVDRVAVGGRLQDQRVA